MKGKYTLGEDIEIRIRNNGDVSYIYSQYYPACVNLKFYDGSQEARQVERLSKIVELPLGLFIIPEGTHCDIANESQIKPGEEVVLLTWQQKECIKDQWGCVESVLVKAGKYTIVGKFPQSKGSSDPNALSYEKGDESAAEWSFTIAQSEQAQIGSPDGSESSDYGLKSLMDDLGSAGATVEELTGPLSRHGFSVGGRRIAVNGETIHGYVFADASTADTEAAFVSPDGWTISVPLERGVIRETINEWLGPPHFYKKGRLIVVYIGDNTAVIDALEGVLGPQFAGERATSIPNSQPPVSIIDDMDPNECNLVHNINACDNELEVVSDSVYFPRQEPVNGERESMTALLIGELVQVTGCLRVNANHSDTSYLPVWPPDFTLSVEDNIIQVLDREGQVVARVGEEVYMDGGEIGSVVFLAEGVRESLPSDCPGPYWIVGDTVHEQITPIPNAEPPISIIDDMDPNECNLVHNINACFKDYPPTWTDEIPMDEDEYDEYMGVLTLALFDLKERLGLEHIGSLKLAELERMTWSNGSLGNPQPGMAYTQAEVPGFRMVLESDKESYTYHTSMDRVVFVGQELASDEEHSDTSQSPGMVEVLAPIESVEVLISESFPPQYMLVVVSGLPNGCVRFGSYDMTRDGDTIQVAVTNLQPADKSTVCTMIYGTVEHTIALGSDFESGKTYTVEVNGLTTTFVAQ